MVCLDYWTPLWKCPLLQKCRTQPRLLQSHSSRPRSPQSISLRAFPGQPHYAEKRIYSCFRALKARQVVTNHETHYFGNHFQVYSPYFSTCKFRTQTFSLSFYHFAKPAEWISNSVEHYTKEWLKWNRLADHESTLQNECTVRLNLTTDLLPIFDGKFSIL